MKAADSAFIAGLILGISLAARFPEVFEMLYVPFTQW